MYLSRLLPDLRSPLVRRDLANGYELHRSLFSAFPSEIKEKERLLFRVEFNRQSPHLVILVQSKLTPDWTILDQKGYTSQSIEIKSFDPEFRNKQKLIFRLVANPTKRLKMAEKGKQGKRIGLVRDEDQLAWMERKATENGFHLLAVDIAKVPDQYSNKQENSGRITLHGVRFDGLLEVTDADLFNQCIVSGIGSGKGFGFGLLSVASPALSYG